jgi:hypothetical protein
MTSKTAPGPGDRMRVPNLDWEQLPEHLAAWRPGVRTIRKPFAFGQRPDRTPVSFAIWRPEHGALHPLMGGATGSGKTNTLNVLTAGIVSCCDTVVWYIDVAKKGQAAAPWGPSLDWIAKTPAEAVAMLSAGVRIIEVRSDALAREAALDGDEDKVVPSRQQPHLIIIIDEAAGLLGITTGDDAELALRATELCRQIAQTGRSAGVSVLIATQRPTVASLGNDGDLRAQLFPNICLKMNQRGDTSFVLRGVDLDLIDATQLNRAGLLYLQDAEGTQPIPTRSFGLYRPGAIRALGRLYAPHRPTLEAIAIRAAGVAYARRPADPFGLQGAVDLTPAPAAAVAPASSGPAKPRISSVDPGSLPTDDDRASAASALQKARSAVVGARALVVAGEQLDEVPRIPVGELAANHRPQPAAGQPGDGEKVAVILAVVDVAPAEGLAAAEIREAVNAAGVDLSRAHAYRLLRQLADTGQLCQSGTKGRYRYHRNPGPAAVEQTEAA